MACVREGGPMRAAASHSAGSSLALRFRTAGAGRNIKTQEISLTIQGVIVAAWELSFFVCMKGNFSTKRTFTEIL
jgi:hypothetical protein